MRRTSLALLAGASTLVMATAANAQATLPQANDQYFTAAAAELQRLIANQPITGHAKNVILFVGDGMGVSTVTAARIYEGQSRGVDGESNQLTIDTFPYTALSMTYSHDSQISDSAPTATAMTTGVKTNAGVIGLTGAAVNNQCATEAGNSVETIFEMAEEAGWATGVISTATITHATPASTYAHTVNRNWEGSAPEGCEDIASQLVSWPYGDGFELALGGGRPNFFPVGVADPENAAQAGSRIDGRDLTAEWVARGGNSVYVWNEEQFQNLAPDARVLGLFERTHMEYEADRANDAVGEPSLAEMTAWAIDRLSQNENGFVLMVEGGRIDHASHAGNAARALIDTVEFNEAIQAALDMTNREDTLIVVTADHSHGLTINGYADRGNPILGLSVTGGVVAKGSDGLPFTTLMYSTGPGSVFPATAGTPAGVRADLTNVDVEDVNYVQQALIPMGSEAHTGEDVAIYSWGPWAHLLTGTVEQNVIFHVMSYASGLGQ